jgi:hypothetical protein
MATPVLCLAFNRPDLLSEVLGAIRAAGPRELFVAVDGPRTGRPDDVELCARAADVARSVDWAPELRLKIEEQNLGCGPAVVSAISWALSRTPEIIVLEDDCLPDPSFFTLCEELLERYRDDKRVMQITGTNWGADPDRFAGYSYAFTSFAPIWGWATWRRAWELNDFELETWPRVKTTGLGDGMSLSPRFRRLLHRDWDRVYVHGGTWDYQWQYSVLRNHGLSVCPERNLIKNIGMRAGGTHARGSDALFSALPLECISFPLRHPPEVARNPAVEHVFERIYWQKRGWPAELFRRLVRSARLNQALRGAFRRVVSRPS